MRELDRYEVTIPTFLLSAIVNGDASGLEDEDMQGLEDYEADVAAILEVYPGAKGHVLSLPEDCDSESYFSGRGNKYANGLACTVVDAEIIILGD